MSVLRVNQITNLNDDGAVEFSEGLTISSDTTISGAGGINLTGIVTATTFVGNGFNLTRSDSVSHSKMVALTYIT